MYGKQGSELSLFFFTCMIFQSKIYKTEVKITGHFSALTFIRFQIIPFKCFFSNIVESKTQFGIPNGLIVHFYK